MNLTFSSICFLQYLVLKIIFNTLGFPVFVWYDNNKKIEFI